MGALYKIKQGVTENDSGKVVSSIRYSSQGRSLRVSDGLLRSK